MAKNKNKSYGRQEVKQDRPLGKTDAKRLKEEFLKGAQK